MISPNHHYFLISQNQVCDITKSFRHFSSTENDRFRNVRFHSYWREKVIALAFAARIFGTQIAI